MGILQLGLLHLFHIFQFTLYSIWAIEQNEEHQHHNGLVIGCFRGSILPKPVKNALEMYEVKVFIGVPWNIPEAPKDVEYLK